MADRLPAALPAGLATAGLQVLDVELGGHIPIADVTLVLTKRQPRVR